MAKVRAILLESVRNVGLVGDIVEISRGYLRFLFTLGKAEYATKSAIALMEANKEKWRMEDEKKRQKALENQALLAGYTLMLYVEASERGILYGSLSVREIAKHLRSALNIEIGPENIILHDAIKELGEHEVLVDLYPGIRSVISLKAESSHRAKETSQEYASQTSFS